MEGIRAGHIQEQANKAGLEGWELTASAGGLGLGPTTMGQTQGKSERMVWCFKRKRP